jgi:hypothetical protein
MSQIHNTDSYRANKVNDIKKKFNYIRVINAWHSKRTFILSLRYTIVSGDKTADFSIGENSGVLRVNRQLDFERKNAYQLTIQVTEGQRGTEKK